MLDLPYPESIVKRANSHRTIFVKAVIEWNTTWDFTLSVS
jgi:hypothetical protein